MTTLASFPAMDIDMLVQALKNRAAAQRATTYAPQTAACLPLEKKAVGLGRQRAVSCQSPVEFLSSSTPNTSPSKLSPPPMLSATTSLPATASSSLTDTLLASHRRLERSFSEPQAVQQQPGDNRPSKSSNINPSRYKTEMCRPFEESGHCKYGDKCQFAHGAHELRSLARHPKYKTDLCRTFHTVGFCPYGPRCHFIHNEDEHKLSCILHQKQQQAVQQAVAQQLAAQQTALAQAQLKASFLQAQQQRGAAAPAPIQRPPKLSLPPLYTRDFLGSSADSPSSSISSESPQSLSPTSGLGDHDVFSPASLSLPFTSPLNVETDTLVNFLAGLTLPSQPPSVAGSTGSSLNSSFHTPPSPPESEMGDQEVDSLLQRGVFRLPVFSGLQEE